MADYSELRRLQTDPCQDLAELGARRLMVWDALPGLLNELQQAEERRPAHAAAERLVSELTSKLALANRALDEANQSITELEAENREVENSLAKERDDDGEIIKKQRERIAQLETERAELIADVEHRGKSIAKCEEYIASLEGQPGCGVIGTPQVADSRLSTGDEGLDSLRQRIDELEKMTRGNLYERIAQLEATLGRERLMAKGLVVKLIDARDAANHRIVMDDAAVDLQHKRINQDAERIAQLQAALREIDTELDVWGDERLRARKEAVRKIARAALAPIPICEGCDQVKTDCKCPQSTATK